MILQSLIEILDRYNLPWLIFAILCWLAIYFLCSWKQFFKAFPVGFWTMVVGACLENFFINHKFWADKFIMIHVGELDLFLIVGPFFFLGIMLVRFLPGRHSWKFLTPITLSLLATAFELLSIKLGFLEYQPGKWSFWHSLFTYLLGLMSALGFFYAFPREDSDTW